MQNVNTFFEQNYKKYLRACDYYYKGRYLKEDLLHDAYLEVIAKPNLADYQVRNNLNYLFLQAIKHQFSLRNKIKKNKQSETSHLYEFSAQTEPILDIVEHGNCETEFYEPILVERIKMDIINGLEVNDHDTQVFVMAQIEPVLSISRRTGISRGYINKSIQTVAARLRKHDK